MYTKTGFMISTSIVLMVSIAIANSGVDASMKAQLQNAVGKDGEPCYEVCLEDCGGPLDECYYCIQGDGDPAPPCQLEGNVLSDDTYNVCAGTGPYYCRFNHTVACGHKFFCESTSHGTNKECADDECTSNIQYGYCRQCERGDPWLDGAINADDELCQ